MAMELYFVVVVSLNIFKIFPLLESISNRQHKNYSRWARVKEHVLGSCSLMPILVYVNCTSRVMPITGKLLDLLSQVSGARRSRRLNLHE